ncbi:MAG: MFS transporter [Leptolyngbyaceae cyanobacterium SL_7_1]|nr:MFS transporter [Leptolyngbyaceae cyanobacterium SL_7_1]
MSVFTNLSTQCRRNLSILFIAGLLFWSSLASTLPTLPLYIGEIGGNSQQIGIVMGAFAIGLLSCRSWLARLADSRGRKLVLLIGMSAVAFAPLGYLVTASMPMLIGVRAFHGISIAAFALAYSALVIDLSPVDQRGELIGYMSLVNPLGLAIGPALGGFLHEWAGYTPAFSIAAVMGMLGLVFTSQVQEPRRPNSPESSKVTRQNYWLMLFSPRIRTPALVLFLIGMAFGTLSTFVPLLFKESNITLNVGLFYTAAAIASFMTRLVAGRASDRFGRGPFISISLLLYAVAMVILWQAATPNAFLLAGFLEGAGAGVLIPMMAALMADRSNPDERGRTFSLCMVGFDIGIALAGPLLGTIATQTGYRYIFGVSAGLAFLGLLVFLTLSSKNLPYSFRFAIGRGRDVYAVKQISPVPEN